MLPELRVLLERAEGRRASLNGLLDALPLEYWGRVASGDAWSIRQHVIHVSTADTMVAELLGVVSAGSVRVWAGGTDDPRQFQELRMRPLDELATVPLGELRASAAVARADLYVRVSRLEYAHLDIAVHVAGAVDRWGELVTWPLREYLGAWAAHDTEHEASIRRAMTTHPDLSTVALTRGRRR